MNHFYRLALWNANGLLQHRLELSTFLHTNKIDIMLISKHTLLANATSEFVGITYMIQSTLIAQPMEKPQSL